MGGHFLGKKKPPEAAWACKASFQRKRGSFLGKKSRRRQPGPARLAFRGNLLQKRSGYLIIETFYRNVRDTLLQKHFLETFGISDYRNILQKRSGYLIIETLLQKRSGYLIIETFGIPYYRNLIIETFGIPYYRNPRDTLLQKPYYRNVRETLLQKPYLV